MTVLEPTLKLEDLPNHMQQLLSETCTALAQHGKDAMEWEDLPDEDRNKAYDIITYLLKSTISKEQRGHHDCYANDMFEEYNFFLIWTLERLLPKKFFQALFDKEDCLSKKENLHTRPKEKASEDKLILIEKFFKYDNFSWQTSNSKDPMYLRIFPHSFLKKNCNIKDIKLTKLANLLNQVNMPDSNELWIAPNPFLINAPKALRIEFEKYYGHACSSLDEILALKEPAYAVHGKSNTDNGLSEAVAQFCWEPAHDRIELKCETIDSKSALSCTLFLHAVIDTNKKTFTHMDGAIYVYSNSDYALRYASNPMHKVDTCSRKKIFFINGDFSFDDGIAIIATFFGDSLVNEYLKIERTYSDA